MVDAHPLAVEELKVNPQLVVEEQLVTVPETGALPAALGRRVRRSRVVGASAASSRARTGGLYECPYKNRRFPMRLSSRPVRVHTELQPEGFVRGPARQPPCATDVVTSGASDKA